MVRWLHIAGERQSLGYERRRKRLQRSRATSDVTAADRCYVPSPRHVSRPFPLPAPRVYPQLQGLACHWYNSVHPVPSMNLRIPNRARTREKQIQAASMTHSPQSLATLGA